MSYSCAKGASNNDINICIVTQTVSPSDIHKSKIYFHQIKDIRLYNKIQGHHIRRQNIY